LASPGDFSEDSGAFHGAVRESGDNGQVSDCGILMSTIEFEGLRYDPSDGTLRAGDGEPRTLRPQVAALLDTFLDRPGEVLDRETLCRAVWGEGRVVDFEAGLAALIKELRQALRSLDAPDDLIETVPRRGYRFRGSVDVDGALGTDHGGVPSANRRWVRLAGALLVLCAVVAGAAWMLMPDDNARTSPRLAVVPFELLGDAGSGNLDLVLADTLLAALWQRELDGMVLLGRTSLGRQLTGRERVAFVARELDASLVLEGSVIAEPDSSGQGRGWRIEARLLRLPRGEVLWAATVSTPPGQPISPAEAAETLASDLAEHWTELRAADP